MATKPVRTIKKSGETGSLDRKQVRAVIVSIHRQKNSADRSVSRGEAGSRSRRRTSARGKSA